MRLNVSGIKHKSSEEITKSYSRQLAREKYQRFHKVKLPRTIVVHHLDGNPFNNDIKNLSPMPTVEHSKYHKPKHKIVKPKRNIILIKKLDYLDMWSY
jgi:hypothetical protein